MSHETVDRDRVLVEGRDVISDGLVVGRIREQVALRVAAEVLELPSQTSNVFQPKDDIRPGRVEVDGRLRIGLLVPHYERIDPGGRVQGLRVTGRDQPLPATEGRVAHTRDIGRQGQPGPTLPGIDTHDNGIVPVSYTHLRAHETVLDLVCRLLLEKKKK